MGTPSPWMKDASIQTACGKNFTLAWIQQPNSLHRDTSAYTCVCCRAHTHKTHTQMDIKHKTDTQRQSRARTHTHIRINTTYIDGRTCRQTHRKGGTAERPNEKSWHARHTRRQQIRAGHQRATPCALAGNHAPAAWRRATARTRA